MGRAVAQNAGTTEEDRVEDIMQRASLHAALVLVFKKPTASRAILCATVAATLIVAGLGIWVGHVGGQLVYVEGAASAYTSPGSAQPSGERSETPRSGAGGGERSESERGEAR